ncbi:MTH538 TIR-like domain [Bosea sp. CRIB-10]|uniref:TIR domain-containing protein n=1 Tax=Bosea sp. CRIB-10 TaxID=378404 RepID=UPI0008E8045D|nr:TIR domain-containing protein [Bosea sp. CRIB-10]SFB66465.1 MTH538 TIR-like domain [Bosea sp. CRIB-10]
MGGSFSRGTPPRLGFSSLGSLGQSAPRNSLLAGLGGPSPSTQGLSSLASLFVKPVRRRAFFSFHFEDIMRVNNVRQSWRTHSTGTILVPSFTDSSLWESKQLEGSDALKKLIREGVEHTSAVCVLAGSETWLRRWVKYEIARAVIDNRGLLTVHINGLNHHQRRIPDRLGPNPLNFLAVGQDEFGRFYLFEKFAVATGYAYPQYRWEWRRYEDYTHAISLPAYLARPAPGYVTPLSTGAPEYCFATDNGSKNIGLWIDRAAQMVGR